LGRQEDFGDAAGAIEGEQQHRVGYRNGLDVAVYGAALRRVPAVVSARPQQVHLVVERRAVFVGEHLPGASRGRSISGT
jgi:2-methylisocitrate lyase-like PEP mutase family enzyme